MDHLISYCTIYVSNYGLLSEEHAKNPFYGTVTFFGNRWESYDGFCGQQEYCWNNGEDWNYSHIGVMIVGDEYKPHYNREYLQKTMYLSFKPRRPKSTENYNLVELKEKVLEFSYFNFKLAIIQNLMFEQEILKPYFDIYDYLSFKKSRANTETSKNIKAAVDFFKQIQIPVSMAEKVTYINMDGGNDIYMNISPLWDGEDGRFDIDSISENELQQFPNLKEMKIMTSKLKKIQEIGEKLGISIE